jgi:hypothetical protein
VRFERRISNFKSQISNPQSIMARLAIFAALMMLLWSLIPQADLCRRLGNKKAEQIGDYQLIRLICKKRFPTN